MPELRKDPIIGRWVIISTERNMRPNEFKKNDNFLLNEKIECPFCEGNEHMTPPEILSYRPGGGEPNKKGWILRVIPNKFPALIIEGELNRRGEGMFDKMNGIGAHEVIIETTSHTDTWSTMELKTLENIIWACRDRILDLKKDKRFKYIMIFKNHGFSAGASLSHTHTQLIALPIIPKIVTEEMEGSKIYFSYKERCIYCDIIKQEIEENKRVITQNDDFIAISPYAPRFPFETWIIPKNHNNCFENSQKHEIENLSMILKKFMVKIDKLLKHPSYNLVIHNSPFNEDLGEMYHWHIEYMPSLTKVAGFEWGTGFYINSVSPEGAAKRLKNI
ncbi:MAG: galactose-1-phosphate uridylyltransferase [Acidobacteriota bacterium]